MQIPHYRSFKTDYSQLWNLPTIGEESSFRKQKNMTMLCRGSSGKAKGMSLLSDFHVKRWIVFIKKANPLLKLQKRLLKVSIMMSVDQLWWQFISGSIFLKSKPILKNTTGKCFLKTNFFILKGIEGNTWGHLRFNPRNIVYISMYTR